MNAQIIMSQLSISDVKSTLQLLILLGIKAIKICYFRSNLGEDFSYVLLILIVGPAGVKSNLEKSGNIMYLLLLATALGLSLMIEDKYEVGW
tara:strand:+ start:382 stop:657 length:276 start_codon:yes stop_codon:yes gene_type:complete